MIPTDGLSTLFNAGALLGVLAIASWTDWRERKVYNWLTFPAMGLGLVLNLAAHRWPGLAQAALGLAAGGLIFFPAYYWGGMGAGDVKLMAAVGALMGWVYALDTAIYASLVGGAAALVFLIRRGELGAVLRRLWRRLRRRPEPAAARSVAASALPYAPIIAAGALAAWFLPSFLIVK